MKVVIPYKPRYPEIHAKMEAARFCVLVAHRRFGKTVLAVNHLIKTALACRREAPHFGYVAPFRNQAKSVAWDYLKRYTRVIPGCRVNESELSVSLPANIGGCKIRIFGADNPDALRGLYFDGVVLDEVAQMKPEVWEEIIQPALADRKGYALFIGTPKGVNLFSQLYHHAVEEEAAGNSQWAALRFPVEATNVLDAEEVARLRNELSENKFRQEMQCDFSASSDDILLTLDEVNAALNRRPDEELASAWPLVIGVDIARFGSDATVFFARRGLIAYPPLILRKKSNTDVAQRLVAHISEQKPRFVNIDQGQGTGVIDIVKDICQSSNTIITEVPFGSRATDEAKYPNKRSEMWDAIRQWIKSGGALNLRGKTAEAIRAELTAPTYSFDAAGRIKLEAKDEIRKRLGHSTDIGDALALTFAIPFGPDHAFDSLQGKYGKVGRSHFKAERKRNVFDPFK